MKSPRFDVLASASLSLVLVFAFLYLDMKLAVALPISLLIGLTCQHVFRLFFNPDRGDVFLPTTLVAGYFLLYFAARAYCLDQVPFFSRLGLNYYDDYIPAALWCACAGYAAFSMGIRSPQVKRWLRAVPHPTQQLSEPIPFSRIVLLMALGLACLIYLFKIGLAVGNYNNREFQRHPPPGAIILVASLTDLSFVAICVFLVRPSKRASRSTGWLLMAIAVGILTLRLAVSGGKVALIQPLLEAAIVFHYGKRRFRIWEIATVGIPVLFLAFGLVNFYRFNVVGRHGSPQNLSELVSRVSSASELLTSRYGGGRQSALAQMVDRDAGTDALALIMKYTPHPFSYVYGLHWLEIPLTFIPRQIWKDKPINLPSAEFELTYMGESTSFNGFSSMHLIADLYRNFSLPGVICGMFILGAMLRFFYVYCSPSRNNSAGLFLYAALFPEIIHSLESDGGNAVIIVTRAVILAIAVAVFLGARFSRKTPAGSLSRSFLMTSPSTACCVE